MNKYSVLLILVLLIMSCGCNAMYMPPDAPPGTPHEKVFVKGRTWGYEERVKSFRISPAEAKALAEAWHKEHGGQPAWWTDPHLVIGRRYVIAVPYIGVPFAYGYFLNGDYINGDTGEVEHLNDDRSLVCAWFWVTYILDDVH